MDVQDRLGRIDWDRIEAELDERGWALTGPLLTDEERRGLIDAYGHDARYRSTVVMARHGYGRGEYRYFAYPLPDPVAALRPALYERAGGRAEMVEEVGVGPADLGRDRLQGHRLRAVGKEKLARGVDRG